MIRRRALNGLNSLGASGAPLLLWLLLVVVHPTAQGEKVFRLGITAAPPSKGNPYSTTGTTPNLFWTAIYDSLTIIDNDGTVKPWLAIAWQPTGDTTWEFKLRPGVVFSNGEPFNAETVKVVLDLLKTEQGAGMSWARDVRRQYASVTVVDDLTVSIETTEPNGLLPNYLYGLHMAPARHLEQVGLEGLVEQPVGTGPFVVEDWRVNEVRLTANPTSWRRPKVDTLEVKFVPDAAARTHALETNLVDVALGLGTDDMARLEAAGHRLHLRAPTRVMSLALLTTDNNSPFKDVRVRQAVNLAVNKAGITQVLLGGLVEPASQPAARNAVGHDPALNPYPYDPKRAKALLADAGYGDGFTFLTEATGGTLPNDTAILQQIAADLAAVGLTMEVRIVPFPQILKTIIQGSFRGLAVLADFNNWQADALRPFTRTNHACRGLGPWYCDERIQVVIDRAERTLDLAERTRLTRQVVKHYRDEATTLLLFPAMGLDGISAHVSHWDPWNDNLMFHQVDVVE